MGEGSALTSGVLRAHSFTARTTFRHLVHTAHPQRPFPDAPMPQPTPARRTFLLHRAASLGALAWPLASAWSAPAKGPRAAEPVVGVDPLLVDSGLTARWRAAMLRDLGWAAQWSPMDTGRLLGELEQGRLDAGIYLSHPEARRLDKEGLIHHRATLARTEVYLVGPPEDPAGIRGADHAAAALHQVLLAQRAGAARWQAAPAGSALAALADELSGGLASRGGHGVAGERSAGSLSAATRAEGARLAAYRLVSRAEWDGPGGQGRGGERLKVWFAGDPALRLDCEVALPFRGRHPTASLLVQWLQWPLGQGVVKASSPRWRPAKV